MRVTPRANVSIEAAAFYNDYDDLRSQEATPLITLASLYGGHTTGVELAGNLQPHARWLVHASYTGQLVSLKPLPGSLDTTNARAEADDPAHMFSVRSYLTAAHVAAQSAPEYDVKAALLLNFARFIEWPDAAFESEQSPIEVCVFAPSPFGQALERVLSGETVANRPLSAREVHGVSDSAGCHLLFVPAGAESRARALFREAGPTPSRRRGVRISARMLQLAGRVERATPEK